MAIADPAQRQCAKNPQRNDGDHSGSADRTLPGLVCHGAILGHDLFGNQPHHKPDPQGHDDQIVEIADDRNEVRNEVDRRKRISGNGNSEKFGIPWHTRIARSEIDRVTVAVEPARPSFDTREHEVLLKSRDARWQIASARHGHIPGVDGRGKAHVAITWPDDSFSDVSDFAYPRSLAFCLDANDSGERLNALGSDRRIYLGLDGLGSLVAKLFRGKGLNLLRGGLGRTS